MLKQPTRAGGSAACGGRQQKIVLSRSSCLVPCRARSWQTITCYREEESGKSIVTRIKPSSDMHATEQAIKTLGQAYMMNSVQRHLHTRFGKEQEVFAGLSRMMLDRFSHDHVLYITDCGTAAAIVLTDNQQASLIEAFHGLDFSIIPGTLQMLVAIPEDSIPRVKLEVEQSYKSGLAAVQEGGYAGTYQQLMLIGVQPGSQNKGLGTALMRAITYAAEQEQQPLLVEVPDESGVGFYAKFGFAQVGHRELHPLMLRKSSHRAAAA